jgi:hypothetical protein
MSQEWSEQETIRIRSGRVSEIRTQVGPLSDHQSRDFDKMITEYFHPTLGESEHLSADDICRRSTAVDAVARSLQLSYIADNDTVGDVHYISSAKSWDILLSTMECEPYPDIMKNPNRNLANVITEVVGKDGTVFELVSNIDGGAAINIISESLAEKLGVTRVQAIRRTRIQSITGELMECPMQCVLIFLVSGTNKEAIGKEHETKKSFMTWFSIMPDSSTRILLGSNTIEHFHIVSNLKTRTADFGAESIITVPLLSIEDADRRNRLTLEQSRTPNKIPGYEETMMTPRVASGRMLQADDDSYSKPRVAKPLTLVTQLVTSVVSTIIQYKLWSQHEQQEHWVKEDIEKGQAYCTLIWGAHLWNKWANKLENKPIVQLYSGKLQTEVEDNTNTIQIKALADDIAVAEKVLKTLKKEEYGDDTSDLSDLWTLSTDETEMPTGFPKHLWLMYKMNRNR